jgi:small redox-active disulfide protein 2
VEIKVLGPGCKRCVELYDLTLSAVEEAGVEATVIKVDQLDQIMAFGIMITPGLVIDGEVLCSGKLPKQSQIVEWILNPAGTAG